MSLLTAFLTVLLTAIGSSLLSSLFSLVIGAKLQQYFGNECVIFIGIALIGAALQSFYYIDWQYFSISIFTVEFTGMFVHTTFILSQIANLNFKLGGPYSFKMPLKLRYDPRKTKHYWLKYFIMTGIPYILCGIACDVINFLKPQMTMQLVIIFICVDTYNIFFIALQLVNTVRFARIASTKAVIYVSVLEVVLSIINALNALTTNLSADVFLLIMQFYPVDVQLYWDVMQIKDIIFGGLCIIEAGITIVIAGAMRAALKEYTSM